MSQGSNDSEDSTSADKVAESLIKAFEERNTQFVRNSLDTYAKEINDTVRELAKMVAALSAQMQAQQATLSTVLNEGATFMSLLYKHDFTSKEKAESSNTIAEDDVTDTKVSKLRFKVGKQRGKRSLPNMGKTTKGVGLKQNPSGEVSVVAKSSHQTNKASSSKQAEVGDDDSDPENFMEEFVAQTSQVEEKKNVAYGGKSNLYKLKLFGSSLTRAAFGWEATGYERLLKEGDHIKNASKGTYVHNKARNVNALEIFDPTIPSSTELDQEWSA
ncbi:hypothetical protein M0R45_006701 [Rubus argutus]|uniref:Uncharacterized protein n=1 Tax=Rubus argutus TaxID=59490 RepID=A0AAW1YRY4_RUBAR